MKLHFNRIDTDGEFPAVFSNNKNSYNFIPINQPIYTAEPSSDRLKMVVEVASSLYARHNMKPEQCAREAIDLITACEKAIKEGENG